MSCAVKTRTNPNRIIIQELRRTLAINIIDHDLKSWVVD